jgi:hypothetical protein
MASGTPGGNWKNAGGNRPTGGGGGGGSRRPWQPGGPSNKPTTGRKKSRFGRFLLAGIATGVLLGLVVLVIHWLKPAKYPSLVVVGPNPGGTSLAVPENAAGGNAAKGVADWARDGDNRPRLAAPPHETADKDAWKARLDPDAKSIVLYFAAHGGADQKGPFLWFVPEGATAPSDEHKLRVRDILDHLAGLRSDRPKLVIFDAARLPAAWAHGMTFNDFARALKELEPEIAKIPKLVVICSSDEDQRAWASEEWRSSVFGHFLLEGLKGAAGKNPGERITAAGLFDYVHGEVKKWAAVNRDERQTPILLPASDGHKRAEEIDLSVVPTSGYVAPPTLEAPGKMPDDLKAAWDTATRVLADRIPPPDTLEPGKWRRYLDLLGRWERLVRQGENPEAVRAEAVALGRDLEAVSGPADPPCLPVAIPAGRSLGVRPANRDEKAFDKLWSLPRAAQDEEWSKQLGPTRPNETLRRIGVAKLVIEKLVGPDPDEPAKTAVVVTGTSKESLQTADELLATVDAPPRVSTAEAHFVRTLNRHLAPNGPPVELLAEAIKLRREAEKVAWVGGAAPEQHPYSEQVFRWITPSVEAGDDARRPGEDLLFGVDPEKWKEAQTLYFKPAHERYAQAKADAAVVTAALNARDRVLARLPYYARWLAAYRNPGRLPPAEVEQLLSKAESAARGTHKLAKLIDDGPGSPPETAARETAARETAARIAEMKKLTVEVNADYGAVVKAFEAEVAALSNTVHPSNWHALDNALGVPFILANDRAKLLGYLREVSHQLLTVANPPAAAEPPPRPAQELAKREGRMALAVLGEQSPELRDLVLTPKPGLWPESYREVGDRIGKRFQGLPAESRQETARAATAPLFRDAGPRLDRAAYLARLTDPVAPLAGEDPATTAVKYWRHYFLLWQARRSVADGWANLNSTSDAPSWYCRDAAKLSLDTARPLARGADPNLAPQEIDRRLADLRTEEGRQPVVLALKSPDKPLAICDEPTWDFQFTLSRRNPDDRVGFPVYWIDEPPAAFGRIDSTRTGRKVQPALVKDASRDESFRFTLAARPTGDPGELVTNVLYRGQPYRKPTKLMPSGPATREVVYNPPKGPAAFSVVADPSSVAGAVTILIDLSGSMKWALNREDVPKPGEPSRLSAAFDAIERVLPEMPRGTTLTVAGFWGEGNQKFVKPMPGLTKVLLTGNAGQRAEIMTAVRNIRHVEKANTPLAWSITQILSKQEGPKYWPDNASGIRTLIVLTDGADNWDEDKAGGVVLGALRNVDDQGEVALHMLFFALGDERAAATRQFGFLRDRTQYRDGRTPAEVYLDLSDASGLAEKMRNALRPRVRYEGEVVAGERRRGRLMVTLNQETGYLASPELSEGTYELRGLRRPQTLRLDPADRVVLRTPKKVAPGAKFDLVVPPVAYEAAVDPNKGWPHSEDTKSVLMTVPELRVKESGNVVDLKMLVTLEKPEEAQVGEQLAISRPRLAWFDLRYADGKPAEPGVQTLLRVKNEPGLVAPAWDVQAAAWDKNRAGPMRPPVVTGYWIASYPGPAGTIKVDLKHPEEAAQQVRQVRVEGTDVGVVAITLEEVKAGDPDLPEGTYLTVRLDYPDRTRPVFVRPGELKGSDQPYALYERHQYYDGVGRYTARFGPLTKADKERRVDLEVHSVNALKAQADAGNYTVVTDCTINGKLENVNRSDRIRMVPGKE